MERGKAYTVVGGGAGAERVCMRAFSVHICGMVYGDAGACVEGKRKEGRRSGLHG